MEYKYNGYQTKLWITSRDMLSGGVFFTNCGFASILRDRSFKISVTRSSFGFFIKSSKCLSDIDRTYINASEAGVVSVGQRSTNWITVLKALEIEPEQILEPDLFGVAAYSMPFLVV